MQGQEQSHAAGGRGVCTTRQLGWLVGAWILGVLVALASPASGRAQPQEDVASPEARDAEAHALFEAGRAAFNDGRFEDALGYFHRAHDLSGRAALLYNIGTAADRLQREAEALAAFEAYLDLLPDAENRREVEGRVRILRAAAARAGVPPETARPASQVVSDEAVPVIAPAENPPRGGVETEWWLWTAIGAVVIGGVVVGAVVATYDPGYEPYLVGHDGVVALTLTVAP